MTHVYDGRVHRQAGSLHVRVRRDAREQEVLSQVSARFASLVHVLTVQVGATAFPPPFLNW